MSRKIDVGQFALLIGIPWYVFLFMAQVFEIDLASFMSKARYINDSTLIASLDFVKK